MWHTLPEVPIEEKNRLLGVKEVQRRRQQIIDKHKRELQEFDAHI